jgi:DNA-directed RNA polymerase subunit M/transcription elongation factor TFIIS
MKVLLKGCTRCGGDLMRARADAETETVTCLQCGYERDISLGYGRPRLVRPVLEAVMVAPAKKKEEVAA